MNNHRFLQVTQQPTPPGTPPPARKPSLNESPTDGSLKIRVPPFSSLPPRPRYEWNQNPYENSNDQGLEDYEECYDLNEADRWLRDNELQIMTSAPMHKEMEEIPRPISSSRRVARWTTERSLPNGSVAPYLVSQSGEKQPQPVVSGILTPSNTHSAPFGQAPMLTAAPLTVNPSQISTPFTPALRQVPEAEDVEMADA